MGWKNIAIKATAVLGVITLLSSAGAGLYHSHQMVSTPEVELANTLESNINALQNVIDKEANMLEHHFKNPKAVAHYHPLLQKAYDTMKKSHDNLTAQPEIKEALDNNSRHDQAMAISGVSMFCSMPMIIGSLVYWPRKRKKEE